MTCPVSQATRYAAKASAGAEVNASEKRAQMTNFLETFVRSPARDIFYRAAMVSVIALIILIIFGAFH
jgi:hypothetical protein